MSAASATPEDAGWWADTLEQLSLELDALVEDFLARIKELESGYPGVPEDDLRDTARHTLQTLIVQLGRDSPEQAFDELAQQIGVKRARQGINRDLLLEAVRLDFRVLWTGLSRVVDPDHASLLLDHAEIVLSVVEQYIREVQTAFLNERELLAQSSRASEVRALARLLSSDRPAEVVSEISQQLSIPLEARYEVILVPASAAEQAQSLTSPLQLTRLRFFTWSLDEGALFLRVESSEEREHPLNRFQGVLISNIPGLVEVPDAVRLAQRLLPYADGESLRQEDDLWLKVASKVLSPMLPSVRSDALGGLRELPLEDQGRLISTFRVYSETGSVKETATKLFVHRNTVDNRLRQFKALTGLDPTVPVDAARALIAVSGEIGS